MLIERGQAYEDAIILSYLVEILDGTALSFALEGSSTAEGFEGTLVRSSGTEQLQCKRNAHNAGTWTVKRLHSEGVLANIVAAAQQGNSVRFVTDQRSVVGELADLARSASTAEDWQRATAFVPRESAAKWSMKHG